MNFLPFLPAFLVSALFLATCERHGVSPMQDASETPVRVTQTTPSPEGGDWDSDDPPGHAIKDKFLRGTDGPDRIGGGRGGDQVAGFGGNDELRGGPGDDHLHGGDGEDRLFGGPGFDTLFGGGGNDELRGGPDGDRLRGQDGEDALWGDEGNDFLDGGPGADLLVGGAGADLFGFSRNRGTPSGAQSDEDVLFPDAVDRIEDFNLDEGDRLDLSDLLLEGGYGGDGSPASFEGYLRLKGDLLQIDPTGNGDFVDLVRIGQPGRVASFEEILRAGILGPQ